MVYEGYCFGLLEIPKIADLFSLDLHTKTKIVGIVVGYGRCRSIQSIFLDVKSTISIISVVSITA